MAVYAADDLSAGAPIPLATDLTPDQAEDLVAALVMPLLAAAEVQIQGRLKVRK